jgi:hypothetical protein
MGFADGPLASAQFYKPTYIAIDPSGQMYISDSVGCQSKYFGGACDECVSS